jgi:hypothetical protein
MVIFGGYRILNALIAEAEKQEKAREKQPEELGGYHNGCSAAGTFSRDLGRYAR